MKLDRRHVLTAGAVVLLGGGVFAAGGSRYLYGTVLGDEFEGTSLGVIEAHAAAASGEVLLVDIRRPDEWADTGSGEGAHRLDMRRKDFLTELSQLAGNEKDTPIALICARGVRSAWLSNQLKDAGFTRIIDVPEGMLGSAAGPGWLARGLPLVKGS